MRQPALGSYEWIYASHDEGEHKKGKKKKKDKK
jgi:hypothetical protein